MSARGRGRGRGPIKGGTSRGTMPFPKASTSSAIGQEDDDDDDYYERPLEIVEETDETEGESGDVDSDGDQYKYGDENKEEYKPKPNKPRIERNPSDNPAPKERRRLTQYRIVEKLAIIKEAKSIGNRPASRKHNIDEKCIRAWRKQEASLEAHNKTRRARLPGSGRKRQNDPLEGALKQYVDSLTERGMDITYKVLMDEATRLWDQYNQKANPTKKNVYGFVVRFVRRYKIEMKKHKKKTAKRNRAKPDFGSRIHNFIKSVRECRRDSNFSKCHIVCADQVELLFEGARTLEGFEDDDETTGQSNNNSFKYHKTRCSVMLTAKADGTKLMPFVVLKENYKRNDDLQEKHPQMRFGYSENGLFNQELILEYLDAVIGPYNRGLLVWDSNRLHCLPSVKEKLAEMQLKSILIPEGLTELLSPAKQYWNSAFTDEYHELYLSWRETQKEKYGLCWNGYTPTLDAVIAWIDSAWSIIDKQSVQNAFLRSGISNRLDGSQDSMVCCLEDHSNWDPKRELLALACGEVTGLLKVALLNGDNHRAKYIGRNQRNNTHITEFLIMVDPNVVEQNQVEHNDVDPDNVDRKHEDHNVVNGNPVNGNHVDHVHVKGNDHMDCNDHITNDNRVIANGHYQQQDFPEFANAEPHYYPHNYNYNYNQ